MTRRRCARVWRMLDRAEYKRRQAPPGVKITRRAFGRDRRYPITNAFPGAGYGAARGSASRARRRARLSPSRTGGEG